MLDSIRLRVRVDRHWHDSVLECLRAYIRIPNKSPAFDPHWEQHGHMERAAQLMAAWCRAQPITGMTVQIRRAPGRTPLLLIDVPGTLVGCVLIYGHLDKQPESHGWSPGLGPWQPVECDDKLYGRGGADDGYAVFSALSAILALQEQNIPHARCLILIEASEESGSIDLPAHLQAIGSALGEPSLVVCLDSECGDYEQLWCTHSVRGVLDGRLRVQVLSEGVHSGLATGLAPSPFRILQQLLARIEDPLSGEILLPELQVDVPDQRCLQLRAAAGSLGSAITAKLPFVEGARPISEDPGELFINNTWRASLLVTGADGLPVADAAGHVLLPEIALRLSLRLPPTCDPVLAAAAVRSSLERDPPYAAKVRFELYESIGGWDALPLAPWLERSLAEASRRVFGREVRHVGCGGTIPLFRILRAQFPDAQFFVTGVLGPQSNAHGPNEFLQLDYAKRVTECVALVLADHAAMITAGAGALASVRQPSTRNRQEFPRV
ncbi:MAG: M20/M25/M40 family metallo-hydrolase [Proteobacteria bacterium]|nr:M20/M25/M40 family metallo-hydrolase [Pseudomonadota bacterium]